MKNIKADTVESKVEKLKALRLERAKLNNEIASLEEQLKDYFKESGIDDLITVKDQTIIYKDRINLPYTPTPLNPTWKVGDDLSRRTWCGANGSDSHMTLHSVC